MESEELERKEAEQRQMQVDAEAAAKATLEAELMAEKEVLRKNRQAAAKLSLERQAPPPGQACKLVLRLPDGRRVEDSFDADEPLAVVYAWADFCGELNSLRGGEHFEVPRKFSLSTTFPRVVLNDQSCSLRELKLFPNAILALTPEDSSHEDAILT